MTRKRFLNAVRIAVAVGGLLFIALALNWTDGVDEQGRFRKGIVSTFADADVTQLAAAFGLMGLAYPLTSLRWWMLLRARRLPVRPWKAHRLNMVGCFFNYCVPVGTTGGDVVKAYYAAAGSGRRTEAVMTVVVDRAAGIIGLFALCGLAGLFMLHDPLARLITIYVGAFVAGAAVLAAVYFSERPRRWLHLGDRLHRTAVGRFIATVDAAAIAYRRHIPLLLAAVVISMVGHLSINTATSVAGFALGLDVPLMLMLTLVPVLMIIAALPISPHGLGTTEAAGMILMVEPGLATANELIGMLLLWRVYQVIWSLIGAMFLLRGDIHLHPQDVESLEDVTHTRLRAAEQQNSRAADGGEDAPPA